MKHNIYAYETVDKQTILELSEFNDLKVNISERPNITVENMSSNNYNILDYVDTGGHLRREISFKNVSNGNKLSAVVNVLFSECATLNGKSVDIKFVYSDIIPLSTSDSNTSSLTVDSSSSNLVPVLLAACS